MSTSVRTIAYRFGSFVLDIERGALLSADGKERPLRPKSFALLRLLVENAGRLLSQEAIMEALWPNIFVTENNVTQCISDIRNALGADALGTIHTRPRRGYLFTSDVSVVLSECGDVQATAAEPQCPAAIAARPNAVPPIRNLAALKEHQHLIAGLPDDIFSDLAQYLVSIVLASSEALRRSGQSASLQEIAREAGMSQVIQGSIQGIIGQLANFEQGIRSAC